MKTLEQVSDETEWWDEVQAYAKQVNHVVSLEKQELWLESYKREGYTPKEAVNEDIEYNT